MCDEMPLNDKLFCAMLTLLSIFIIALVDRFRQPMQLAERTIIYVDRQLPLSPYISNSLIELAKSRNHRCAITQMISYDLDVVSPCGHVFDHSALAQWLAINNTCPICKVGAIC
jgi:hypothetical protein